jgi:predicted RNase H-like HicB family nuclease
MSHNEVLSKNRIDAAPAAIFDGYDYRPAGEIVTEVKPGKAMKTIRFHVPESEGYYVADAIDYPIVTQAKTWNKLMQKIDDVIRLYFKLKNDEKYSLELDINSQALSTVKKSAKA